MEHYTETRLYLRRRVLKEGKIVIHPPSGTIDVTIRNLGVAGAKLEIPPTVQLPDKFDLINVSDGNVTPVEVMWRKANFVGVHFCGETKNLSLRRT
jgi:hypothetical protein